MKKKHFLLRFAAVSIALGCLIFGFPASAKAETVYVAGNPDFYPVEYYDTGTKQYEGIMPEILKEVSEKTGYQFLYIAPSETDERMRMAKNKQVEIVSGYTRDEMLYDASNTELFRESPVILEIAEDGKPIQVCFAFTSIASEELIHAFHDALEQIEPQWVSSVAVSTAMQEHHRSPKVYVLFIALLLLILLTAVAVIFIIYRKKTVQQANDKMADAVTGIGNKQYLEHFFEHYVSDSTRALYAAVYLGIDTDSLSERLDEQEIGDVLVYTADVLSKHSSETDAVAHIQRGRFVVLLLCSNEEVFTKWIHTVSEEISAYPQKYAKDCVLRANCGVYFMKNSDKSMETILFNARQSYKNAVANGKVYAVSNPAIVEKAMEERALRGQIQDAIQKNEFQMFLQFFCTPDNKGIVGAEALIRWYHPQRGVLKPSRFLSLVEKERKFEELDLYMLECCCRQLVIWKDMGKPYFLSCNFSRITAAADDLLSKMEEVFAKYDFAHENLVIEITEESIIRKGEQMLENMYGIKKLGCLLSLDDFGSGYTSFKDISSYPFDIVKIDKSIVDQAGEEKGSAVLNGVIQFVHSLNLKVICEGIESKEQAEKLGRIDCDYLQGFYYYRPIPAKEASRILQENG